MGHWGVDVSATDAPHCSGDVLRAALAVVKKPSLFYAGRMVEITRAPVPRSALIQIMDGASQKSY
jgi:hypothetical protein